MRNLHDIFVYRDGCLYWKTSPFKGFSKSGRKAGTPNGGGYLEVKTEQITGTAKVFQLHRLVWELHNGPIPSGMVVDHINRDIKDNRIENLRLATISENCMNASGKASKRSNLPKNVHVDWSYGGITKYRAQVCKAGVAHRIGGFDTPELAAEAAEKLRATKHGEFAHGSVKEM